MCPKALRQQTLCTEAIKESRRGECPAGEVFRRLQRTQEIDEQVLLSRGKKVEFIGHGLGLVAVILNDIVKGAGPAIMQQFGPGTDTPKRRRDRKSTRLNSSHRCISY